jgi:hypothetical protein
MTQGGGLVIDHDDLKRAAEESAELVSGVPIEVRPALAVEVFRVITRNSGGENSVPASPAPQMARASTEAVTLAEFLSTRGDLSHPDRLAAIAAYRYERQNVDVLHAEDFRAAYREIRTPMPQNLSLNIGRCMQRGWLVEAGTKEGQKAWRITQTGLRHVGTQGE